jgi:hypothetical protein
MEVSLAPGGYGWDSIHTANSNFSVSSKEGQATTGNDHI